MSLQEYLRIIINDECNEKLASYNKVIIGKLLAVFNHLIFFRLFLMYLQVEELAEVQAQQMYTR